MAVSIGEVAAQAGVSRSTVSQVLNDNLEARIAPETRERVRRVAQEIGYQPNRLARSLGRRRTDTVGLMISGLRNPFFVGLLEAAETAAREAGYQVLADTAPASGTGTYSEHGRLRGWPVDGVLMWAFPAQTLDTYLGPQARDLPVVYLGYAREDGAPSVAFDLYGGGRLAAEHLLRRGYHRLAYLYPYENGLTATTDLRHRAYEDVCREAGREPRTIVMPRQEETRAAGLEAGLMLASLPPDERPDAVLCFNDIIAVGVYHGLLRAGLRIPDDIALVGFDGIEEAAYLDRPLTTLWTPPGVLCRHGFDLLARCIQGDATARSQQIVVPTVLQLGATS